MRVRIQYIQGKRIRRKPVDAEATACKWFAITPYYYYTQGKRIRADKRYVVLTHIPTGRRVTQASTKTKCRKLAKVLNKLPIPWGRVNSKTSANYGKLLTAEARQLMW